MGDATDYRLTADELRAEGLPLELDAYPYYPEGVHVPVGRGGEFWGELIVTGPWCSTPEREAEPERWCTLGVYSVEGSGDGPHGCAMIDLERSELASHVIHLLADLRHDEEWIVGAVKYIDVLFEEGKG